MKGSLLSTPAPCPPAVSHAPNKVPPQLLTLVAPDSILCCNCADQPLHAPTTGMAPLGHTPVLAPALIGVRHPSCPQYGEPSPALLMLRCGQLACCVPEARLLPEGDRALCRAACQAARAVERWERWHPAPVWQGSS
mmetsp:Transcript_24402/g.53309  ORF Transcript_24402/g.53309 Transcript_24402/m.53309 type:complete len:137 (+) Transcript_24402:103-513(+)